MKSLFLLFILFACGFSSATAVADTFDPKTNILTMGSITVGNQKYLNVAVKLDQFTVLDAGSSAPLVSGVSETCGEENFTIDKYNVIQVGMSLQQVSQILGCQFDDRYGLEPVVFSKTELPIVNYVWVVGASATNLGSMLIVHFVESDLTVSGWNDNFKTIHRNVRLD